MHASSFLNTIKGFVSYIVIIININEINEIFYRFNHHVAKLKFDLRNAFRCEAPSIRSSGRIELINDHDQHKTKVE